MNIPLPLDDASRAKIRPISKAIFNSEYALEAMAFIAQAPQFYAKEVAEKTGCERNYAGTLIKQFAAAKTVERVETESGQPRKVYRRVADCPFWELGLAWLAYLLDEPESDIPRLTLTTNDDSVADRGRGTA